MKVLSWEIYLLGVLALVVVYYVFLFSLFWRVKRKTKQFLDLEKEYGEKFDKEALIQDNAVQQEHDMK